MIFQHNNNLSRWRIWLARSVAVAADALQIAAFPAFIGGAPEITDDVLDVAVAIILTLLVGWHIAFIPSFVVKLLPVADLAPTWTIAILVATRGKKPAQIEDASKQLPQ